MNCFIAGTDTEVGKTFCSALLTRALRSAGVRVVAMKPICCGRRDDADALWDAAGRLEPIDRVNPVWLRTPAAPLAAAMLGEPEADVGHILAVYRDLRDRYESVLVEGAGGWLVPVTPSYSMADLAAAMQLPVLVVVANRLGAINHTLLTVESIRARGLQCAGLILNETTAECEDRGLAEKTNRTVLERTAGVPVLAEVKWGQRAVDLADFR